MYLELTEQKYYNVHMGAARFALDLSDGSERGEYVDQDYILAKLSRPHRAINLMYCYYPLDESWPSRARDAHKGQDIEFQWDYPYDDYFPYMGGLEGDRKSEPFTCMKDIRKHGQDVILTMTIDPRISDEQIKAIAEDLKDFGRLQLRINHEATGNWFAFTKKADYQEIANFFIHARKLIKEIAPHIDVIICIGGIEDPEPKRGFPLCTDESPMLMEDIFTEAVKAADIWSVDKYMALHWGWPFDIADSSTQQYKRCDVKRVYELTKLSYQRFSKLSGEEKPMYMSEFNADGDVVGPFEQIDMMKEFFALREADEDWLTGITFYQFRDRGRLGLEIEDPNNKNIGIEQPILKEYKKLLNSPLCLPKLEKTDDSGLNLRWGGSEDATGVEVELELEKIPTFLELYFEDELADTNLMIKCNERWFYKGVGTTFVDLMPVYFDNPDSGKISEDDKRSLTLTFFAPPKDGVNVDDGHKDWRTNYYTTLPSLPKLRIEYEPILPWNDTLEDFVNY